MGITRFFYERTSTMRSRLKKYFPDIWEKIYVTALLRTFQGNRFRRLQVNYEDSILYYMFPEISFFGSAMTGLLDILERRREAMRMFMQEDVADGESFLLCDGHRLGLMKTKHITFTFSLTPTYLRRRFLIWP